MNQKSATAAGRVEHLDFGKPLFVVFKRCKVAGAQAVFILEPAGFCVLCVDLRFVDDGEFIGDEQAANFLKCAPESFFNDVSGDSFRRVVNAVGFAFGKLHQRLLIRCFGLHDFEVGNRLLKNTPQGVKAYSPFAAVFNPKVVMGGKVQQRVPVLNQACVARPLIFGTQNLVGHHQGIQGAVDSEHAAIKAVQRVRAKLAAVAHGAKNLFDFAGPQVGLNGVEIVASAFGGENVAQQVVRVVEPGTHILAKKDKQKTIQQLLREAHQRARLGLVLRVMGQQGTVKRQAIVAVFKIKAFLQAAFVDALAGQQCQQGRLTAEAQKPVAAEQALEQKPLHASGFGSALGAVVAFDGAGASLRGHGYSYLTEGLTGVTRLHPTPAVLMRLLGQLSAASTVRLSDPGAIQ